MKNRAYLEIDTDLDLHELRNMLIKWGKENKVFFGAFYDINATGYRERTDWYSKEIRETGLRLSNTRIVETEYQGEPRLEVFNSYMEFHRLGEYHAYWNVKEAIKLNAYLSEWIRTTLASIRDKALKEQRQRKLDIARDQSIYKLNELFPELFKLAKEIVEDVDMAEAEEGGTSNLKNLPYGMLLMNYKSKAIDILEKVKEA